MNKTIKTTLVILFLIFITVPMAYSQKSPYDYKLTYGLLIGGLSLGIIGSAMIGLPLFGDFDFDDFKIAAIGGVFIVTGLTFMLDAWLCGDIVSKQNNYPDLNYDISYNITFASIISASVLSILSTIIIGGEIDEPFMAWILIVTSSIVTFTYIGGWVANLIVSSQRS